MWGSVLVPTLKEETQQQRNGDRGHNYSESEQEVLWAMGLRAQGKVGECSQLGRAIQKAVFEPGLDKLGDWT